MTGEREEAMQITDQEAQYDASAKRLLAQKYVLAHLLVKTVKEFREMVIYIIMYYKFIV